MNPGLVVKLRPTGPWRIGPDSGVRNRVDVIYHSDSLYSAVTSAMSRMGSLEAWLDATARAQAPAVCFSSCFPFIDGIAFVVPPRSIWPPTSPLAMSARVRWKSARFVPLSVVESVLSDKKLNENQWSVDGSSGCLVPAGKPGPFRTSVRWNAAVDRLSGTCERHATACIEFREGCGLWTVAGFRDEAARDEWQGPVKAAFRLLADTGFGGERSRGWGRAETPEFVEGTLPGLIVKYRRKERRVDAEVAVAAEAEVAEADNEWRAVGPETDLSVDLASALEAAAAEVNAVAAPETEPATEAAPETDGAAESIGAATFRERFPEQAVELESEAAAEPLPDSRGSDEPAPEAETAVEPAPGVEPAGEPQFEVETSAAPETEGTGQEARPTASVRAPELTEPLRVAPDHAPAAHQQAHWLLSLYTPAADDAVDWGRGSYAVLARGGRIDSPSGSGELKKQIQMVAEGSVLCVDGVPLGAAPDVAPDGFAHPVFRAGFALAIPLPEVH
jgi:CRISPR type III-A-associated RAMP protein Csm4